MRVKIRKDAVSDRIPSVDVYARTVLLVLAVTAFVLICTASAYAEPNLEGAGGLINTPSAEATEDGVVYLGLNKNLNLTDDDKFSGLVQYSYFFNIGFLPHLEISGRIVRFPDYEEERVARFGDYKDREGSIKFQLLDESDTLPAFAIGAMDIGGESRHQEAYYAVAQKTLMNNLRVNIGGGTGKFEGVFGGIDWEPSTGFHVMAEYDTESVNAGLRYSPTDWLTLTAASLDGEEFGYGIVTRFDLLDFRKRKHAEPRQPVVRWDPAGGQADPRVLADRLVEYGFENVRAFVSDDELIVFYENRMYLLEERALGLVLIISCMHAPEGIDKVRVITLLDDVPHLDTVVPPDEFLEFVRGESDLDSAKSLIDVDYHRSIAKPEGVKRLNETRLKTDFFFKPGIDFDAGKPFEPFRQRITLLLDPEVKLGRGLFARGRASYTVNNNLNDIDGFNIERGWLGFTGRAGNFSWLAKGGLMDIDQYGGNIEAEYDIQQFNAVIGGNFGYLDDRVYNTEYVQAVGKFEKRFPKYDLTARVCAGQFQYEDTGLSAEVTRYFGPVEVSFFAYRTGNDSFNEGGVSFFVPLPFYDDGHLDKVRFGIAPEWSFTYRTEDAANALLTLSGQDLRMYRSRLHPDYILAHLDDLRRARSFLK
ncbi:YjbH domain-containing protein [bacterium]|nr:YjbH domain-containing protein [bacterium]